jgi:phage terminase large subunit GpA-like protein
MRAALRVKRNERGEEQPPMLCSFPSDYSARYFDMLNAEEMLADGSFDSGGRRNEATDCRVYNLCAAESYINEAVASAKENYRKRGYTEFDTKAINKQLILQKIENNLTERRAKSTIRT